jgi:hypothetical protein
MRPVDRRELAAAIFGAAHLTDTFHDQLRNARCWRWQRAEHCTKFDELPEVRKALEAMSATFQRGNPAP